MSSIFQVGPVGQASCVASLPRRRWIVGGGLAALGWAAGPAAAQFKVEISGVGATQIPVAIAPFRGETAAVAGGAATLSAIVRADLERSGLFRLVPATAPVDEGAQPAFEAWRGQGADALVGGSVERLANGALEVRWRLWDVVKGQELASRAVTLAAGDHRLAAHRTADEVYFRLTGERGVFATRIAYVTKTGPRYALHVTDADGEGGHIALTSAEPIISPAWSPSGRELAYVSFEQRKAAVWVQDVLTGRRMAVANFRGSNSAPAWHPNGRELALTLSRDGGAQLYAMGRDGGTPRRITQSRAIDTEPCYSPDGRTVYFVSDRAGGPQIYRTAASGEGAVERLTFQGNYNISPSVSPDGRQLTYITRQGEAFRVAVLDLGSGNARTVTTTQDDESPSFAPNGKLIVYATRQGGRDVLMTTTLDGRVKTRLLSSGADVREPAWGPFTSPAPLA